MDKNLEMLIDIGETCLKAQYSPTDILWCTSLNSITVQSLLDLKKYRNSPPPLLNAIEELPFTASLSEPTRRIIGKINELIHTINAMRTPL